MKRRGPVPGVEKKKKSLKVIKTKPFGKGTVQVVRPRSKRIYEPDRIKKKYPKRTHKKPHPLKIRSSLTPGTVCIVLSGRCRGRRVILLKVLESGLLLVTGPYKANGVPLRRINPAYVIGSSTKIDISSVNIPKTLKDDLFKKPKLKKFKKGAADFLGKGAKDTTGEKKDEQKETKDTKKDKKGKKSKSQKDVRFKKNKIAALRIKLQKEVDEQIIPIVKKEQYMFDYLGALFTLEQGQYPHEIKF